jgi:hypothetical protein
VAKRSCSIGRDELDLLDAGGDADAGFAFDGQRLQ